MNIKRTFSGSWFTRIALISSIICALLVYFLFKNMEQIVHGQLYYYGLISSPDWKDPYRLYTWLVLLCLGLPAILSSLALVASFLKTDKTSAKKIIIPKTLLPPPVVAKTESQRINEEVPEAVKEPPEIVEDLPATDEELPEAVEELPEIVEELPKSVQEVPEIAEDLSGNTEEPPEVVEQLSMKAEKAKKAVRKGGITCCHCKKVFSRALVMLDFRDGKNQMVSICPYCNHVLESVNDTKEKNEFFDFFLTQNGKNNDLKH